MSLRGQTILRAPGNAQHPTYQHWGQTGTSLRGVVRATHRDDTQTPNHMPGNGRARTLLVKPVA